MQCPKCDGQMKLDGHDERHTPRGKTVRELWRCPKCDHEVAGRIVNAVAAVPKKKDRR